MPDLETLQAAATRKECIAAFRLIKRSDWPAEKAFEHVLNRAAGERGLEALLCERKRMQEKQAAALNARHEAKRMAAASLSPPLPDHGDFWLAWFDGSAHPNPGRIGLGGVIEAPCGTRHEICKDAGTGDSNEAEYLALIAVLEKALSFAVLRLRLWGDSQVVVDDVNNDLKQPGCKGARGLEHHRAAVRALLEQFDSVELRWVPRHKNAAADRLSQKARSLG